MGRHFGGAEYYLFVIINKWLEDGNKAIAIVRRGSAFANFIKEKIHNIQIEEVDFSITDIVRIKKIFKNEEINVVNVNGINSGIFINFVTNNIPRVTTIHSNAELDRSEKPYFVRKAFVLMENYCLRKSRKIIAVSDAIKELLISRKTESNSIDVVNNGVKFINYPERCFRHSEEDLLKICYIGRLEKVKGCKYLIQALELLEHCNYQCDIYGDGNLMEKLTLMVLEKKLDNKIQFMGFSEKIREYLPNYDVLVIPSLFEASPLIIPEAMNAKTLLVCSNVGGIPWIIDDGKNGYLFEKGNARELSEILRKVYECKPSPKTLIENAYNDFINNYTEDIMVKKTFSILKNI